MHQEETFVFEAASSFSTWQKVLGKYPHVELEVVGVEAHGIQGTDLVCYFETFW